MLYTSLVHLRYTMVPAQVLIFSLRKLCMSQTITLYVDGACRGNPGLGDGARTLLQKLKNINCVAVKTTPPITVWNSPRPSKAFFFAQPMQSWLFGHDSTYVKRGITEWITG